MTASRSSSIKSVLVLSRRNHQEAMRVAAGLTIFGHEVRLVFMGKPLTEEDATGEQAELMELADIEPETTIVELADELNCLDATALGAAIQSSDLVVNI